MTTPEGERRRRGATQQQVLQPRSINRPRTQTDWTCDRQADIDLATDQSSTSAKIDLKPTDLLIPTATQLRFQSSTVSVCGM